MTAMLLTSEALPNPVDAAELVLMERDLSFDRLDDGELVAEIGGLWCKYRLWFNWQEDARGLTLGCAYETKVSAASLPRIYALLALANEKLWLGHFEVSSEDNTIAFRHTLPVQEGACTSPEQLQSLLDIALQECERLYPAVQSVVWGGKGAKEALEIAIFDTIAEA